jgi:hypothetical protein
METDVSQEAAAELLAEVCVELVEGVLSARRSFVGLLSLVLLGDVDVNEFGLH